MLPRRATGEDTTTLIATNNQISDLGALTGLGELDAVTLDHNKIVDLGPLSGATKLSRLLVSDNKIADLTPLASTGVSTLYVDDNSLAGLDGVEGLSMGRLSVATALPAMCTHDMSITWDQGSCAPPPDHECFAPIELGSTRTGRLVDGHGAGLTLRGRF